MNKKFTTLLASVMLASAFSAGAVDKGASVLLKSGSEYLSVQTGTSFGSVSLESSVTTDLAKLNKATWKVSAKGTTLGKTIYSFVNKATGLPLSVDPAVAVDQSETTGPALALGGSATEWVDESGKLVSYFKGDSVLFIKGSGSSLFLAKGKLADVSGMGINEIDLASCTDMKLKADDLNTLLQSSVSTFFGLTMNPEVSSSHKNYLTATGLKAVATTPGTLGGEWVNLQAKGQKKGDKDAYVVVDTAYYDGTEDSKFLQFTYDKLGAANRENGSYEFFFTYNAAKDELYAQVKKVVYKLEKVSGITDANFAKAIKEDNNNSLWSVQGISSTIATQGSADEKHIYMARLAGTNVLTVNTEATQAVGQLPPAVDVQKTVIKLGTNFSGLTLTTIPDGVYLIKYKSTGGHNPKQNDSYALANLAGNFGWAAQAKRQDFNHMPAAQWVIKKNGTSSTATVTIDNREFSDLLIQNTYGTQVLPDYATQFFAVEGSKDVFYYPVGSTVADTLSFEAVDANLLKNTKLGYKYVNKDSLKIQTYTFNYLHGLALDKYLYTPAGKDSIVRVDENDAHSNFRLELVVENDNYGYDDALVRNVYRVYTIKDGEKRYLSYDSNTKKYMMKPYYTPFFLKENNCIDGKHYYTLVAASLETAYDKDGHSFWIVKDHSKINAYDASNLPVVYQYPSNQYAYVKVSVDDNTLDLTQGNLDDKFIYGTNNEIRTSAFAVEIDNSPLYRRFNNVALDESATDAADSLAFVESIRKEYLMDEWNSNLTAEKVDYAGIWNAEKANGKLFFHVDTAWVERGLGNIKPQYLVSVAREDQEGTPGVPCTYDHNHYDNNGNLVDAAHCGHATLGHAGFAYGKYLVNFSDSASVLTDRGVKINPYLFNTTAVSNSSYTRAGFVKAIHSGDSLFVLTNGFEKMKASELDTATIIANYKKAGLEKFIVNLKGDQHKNVTWSFRYINPDNAGFVTKEGEANSFLFESNVYFDGMEGTSYVYEKYQTVHGDADRAIAPDNAAAWLKMHNGCLVLTDRDATFNSSKTGGDGALVFNVQRMTEGDSFVTSNDEVAVEGVSIVAGNGTVTIQGAAGKSVVISNILGKVVAETVLTSDNATISVPAGIVAVAVEGEDAVKTIVK
ncbi:MAG: DUF6383 domain-containing protein [Parabacteroides sp.]|nr:DUF6383 domain-containing protein [Parabacteroides sp.]